VSSLSVDYIFLNGVAKKSTNYQELCARRFRGRGSMIIADLTISSFPQSIIQKSFSHTFEVVIASKAK